MESRRTSKRKSEIEIDEELEELTVETSDTPLYNNTVKLQLKISAKVIAHGAISGKRYSDNSSLDRSTINLPDDPLTAGSLISTSWLGNPLLKALRL